MDGKHPGDSANYLSPDLEKALSKSKRSNSLFTGQLRSNGWQRKA
jgi:hypothetical protein